MTCPSILPSNNSPLQHALAKLSCQELAAIDWRVIMQAKDPTQCAEHWLPWLAWERSIGSGEGWDFAETESARRNLISDYVHKHQVKGTPDAIRRLFRDLGLGEIDIVERASNMRWNGRNTFNGANRFGGADGDWAKYGVTLRRIVTRAQGEMIKQMLEEIAPARCQLLFLDFRSAALHWNGEIRFDNTYTYGAINHG